jgi:ADP-ribosylglycohydrolase
MDEKIADRIRGTILGSACGNSLGGSCIGMNRKDITSSLGPGGLRDFSPGLSRSYLPDHQPGALLADTFLALELAESIIDNAGQFSAQDLKERYKRLLETEEFLTSAPGAPCLAALRRMVDSGETVDDGSPEALHDNGAARAYPLGCLPDRLDAAALAVEQARLTTGDSRVWAAAAVIAHTVGSFVRDDAMPDELSVRAYVRREFEVAAQTDSRFAEWWDDVAPDLDYAHPAHELPYSLLNVESNVNEAVPTAVGIFLIFRHNLEEAICAAAAAGGDTDTAGAIVGALAGAYHGASAIPQRWLDKIAHRDRLERVAEGLMNLW